MPGSRLRKQRRRRHRRGPGRPPTIKDGATPRRGQRTRPGVLQYWLRRPEPSVAVAAIYTAFMLLLAALSREWAMLVLALPGAGGGLFVWATRDIWRMNADRWREGYDGAF